MLRTLTRQRPDGKNSVVLIDGLRTPFVKSNGKIAFCKPHELLSQCLRALMNRIDMDPANIDYAVGSICAEDTVNANLMRQAILHAELPSTIHGVSLTNACIGGLSATTMAINAIETGRCGAVIVGSSDLASALPVRYTEPMEVLIRSAFNGMNRSLTSEMKLNIINALKPHHFSPDHPYEAGLRERTTGYLPGQHIDIENARKWKIPRETLDEFTLASHLNAGNAWERGYFNDHIVFPKSLKKLMVRMSKK